MTRAEVELFLEEKRLRHRAVHMAAPLSNQEAKKAYVERIVEGSGVRQRRAEMEYESASRFPPLMLKLERNTASEW